MAINISSILKTRRQIIFCKFSLKHRLQEVECLTRRLFIQAVRRPSSLLSGIIQPLLWLILFSSLFQNIPINTFRANNQYGAFLSCGIIVFTSFTGSLNAGLPLMFDREFGFLNRLLVAPAISRYGIILAATLFIICITMIQSSIIGIFSIKLFGLYINNHKKSLILAVLMLITCSISNLSLGLALTLPGHIEFLAIALIVNLPMLFASTALAPLHFMPYWLQVISKFNLLTYAIESTRFIALKQSSNYETAVIQVFNANFNLTDIMTVLTVVAFLSFLTTKYIATHKIE